MTFSLSDFVQGKKVLVLGHAGADVDSVSSAATIYYSFQDKAKITIGCPNHASLLAQEFAKNMNLDIKTNPDLKEFDCLIFVDFNSNDMLGNMKKAVESFKKPILVLDHHDKMSFSLKVKSIINPKAVSTTEVIYGLLKDEGVKINSNAATAIAVGIIVDSANFKVADHETFKIMADVSEKSGKKFIELISLFKVKKDVSEIIAQLKAAKRARIFRSHDYIIATTEVSCFESSAATSLIKLGADIAFAGGEDDKKENYLISARVNNEFLNNSNFDLPKHIFEKLGKEFNGAGGGHPGAAAFNGKGPNLEKALERCASLATDFISKLEKKPIESKEY